MRRGGSGGKTKTHNMASIKREFMPRKNTGGKVLCQVFFHSSACSPAILLPVYSGIIMREPRKMRKMRKTSDRTGKRSERVLWMWSVMNGVSQTGRHLTWISAGSGASGRRRSSRWNASPSADPCWDPEPLESNATSRHISLNSHRVWLRLYTGWRQIMGRSF